MKWQRPISKLFIKKIHKKQINNMDTIGLKYKSEDTFKLIDIFCNLSDGIKDDSVLKSEIEKLSQYPTPVIEEFLKCIKLIKPEDIKNKYHGVVGYITMRLNFVDMFV